MTNIYLTLTLVFQTLYVLHVPLISGDVQKRDIVLCKTHWNFLALKLAFRAHILIPPLHG
jgi:hypothetical protein